jgi:phage protein D
LTRARKTRSFVNKADSDIVKDIAADSKLSASADRLGKPRPFTMQVDQTDYDYLMNLARLYNCRVWTEGRKLFFKSINVKTRPVVTMAWEKDGLLEFSPILNTAGLVTAVEVRGWDNQKSQPIVGTATTAKVKDKIGGRKLGADTVKAKFGEARMIYISDTIRDKKTAEDVARDVLTRNSMEYIVASGKCIGNNKVLAGAIVKIDNVGKRFSGEYYARSVRHEYRRVSGYYTLFSLERNCT